MLLKASFTGLNIKVGTCIRFQLLLNKSPQTEQLKVPVY